MQRYGGYVFCIILFALAPTLAAAKDDKKNQSKKQAIEIIKESKDDEVVVASPKSAATTMSAPSEVNVAKNDMAFQQALALAYDQHPQILAERKAYEAQAEEIAKAVAEFLPRFGLGYERGRNTFGLDNRPDIDTKNTTKSAYAEQPIFEGGGSLARLSAAKNYTRAAAYFLAQREQEILLQAATAYMDLYLATQLVELNQRNVAVLKEQSRIAKARFDVGELTRTDTSQAEARLATAQAGAEQADGQLLRAKAAYQRVFNAPPPVAPVIPHMRLTLPTALDDLLAQTQAQHPLFLRANALKQAAANDENSALARLLPTVAFSATRTQEEGQGLFASNRFENDALRLTVNIPLYQGGAEYATIRQREKVSEQRKYEVMDAENFARENAIQAWEQWQTALATEKSADLAKKAAGIALTGVKQEHELGERTMLDVLDAERELFQSQLLYQQAQRDGIVAQFAVLSASGTLTPQTLQLQTTPYNTQEKADAAFTHVIGF